MTGSCVLRTSVRLVSSPSGVVRVWNLVGEGDGLVVAHCWALRDQAGRSRGSGGGCLVAWCLPWSNRTVCVGLVVGGLVV
jgi:hypothetical protein